LELERKLHLIRLFIEMGPKGIKIQPSLPINLQPPNRLTEINMNVSSTTSALVSTSTEQSDSADAVSIAVLRKALDLQGSAATALIQSLPQPSLATQGNVGTKVNTFA
jgi:hypothetical protein